MKLRLAVPQVTPPPPPPAPPPLPLPLPPPPPPPPANLPPTALSLSNASVGENQPAGTTVGTLSGTDADAGDTLSFSLVSGTGSADNGSFAVAGSALNTTAAFDFETKSSYAIRVRVADGRGGTFERELTISVIDANDPPAATASGTLVYTENDAATAIAPALTVADADSATLTGATVRISANHRSGEDLLALPAQPGITGAFDGTTGTLTLSGSASVAAYQAALRAVTYANASDSPSIDARTVTFSARDGGGFGAAGTRTITVAAVNDPPAITTSPGPLAYADGGPATAIDPGLTLTDLDGSIASATVQITGNLSSPQDVLALALAPGILASYDAATGTLSLTGSATAAAYQTALRAVTYRNTSGNPSTAARTVTFIASDGVVSSPPATRAINVSAVDDAPVAVNDSATVLEDSGASAVTVLANDTDGDGGPKSIASVTQPANGTVVITGGETGLTYAPSANYCNAPPGTSLSTFTYTITPGSSVATVSMTVTCVNDAPVADDETFNGADAAVGNTALIGNDPSDGAPTASGPKKTITADILAGDGDSDGPGPLVVAAGTFASNDGGTVVLEADGDFTYTPAAGTSCNDTSDFFDYTVSDQNPGTAGTDAGRVSITITGCVWYVSNNAAGNAGTSTAPFDTLAQAQTASAAGHTIYVLDGDSTSTGYAAGVDLKANQRLLGEAATLQVGTDVLQAANAAARPTITDSNADVVSLAAGNTVRGVQLDPPGSGGAIAGGAGDAGGTIDDVRIIDTGAAGTQPSLELNATSGTFDLSSQQHLRLTGHRCRHEPRVHDERHAQPDGDDHRQQHQPDRRQRHPRRRARRDRDRSLQDSEQHRRSPADRRAPGHPRRRRQHQQHRRRRLPEHLREHERRQWRSPGWSGPAQAGHRGHDERFRHQRDGCHRDSRRRELRQRAQPRRRRDAADLRDERIRQLLVPVGRSVNRTRAAPALSRPGSTPAPSAPPVPRAQLRRGIDRPAVRTISKCRWQPIVRALPVAPMLPIC